MKRRKRPPYAACLAVAVVTAVIAAATVTEDAGKFVTVNPSISQRFVSIPNESTLADFCYRLSELNGITGVSYRNYDALRQTAIVTVFYNPKATTPRNIRIYLEHSYVLWTRPMST